MRKALLLAAGVLLLAGCGPRGGNPSAGRSTSTTIQSTASSATSSATGTASSASVATSTSPAPPSTLQQAFDTGQSGVVRFEVAGCGTAWQGSGFQLSPNLIATVAHVVDQGRVIRVIEGTTATAGTVIGLDQGTDVALVRTVVPVHGHAFTFADAAPRVGDQIAALGFPEGEPLGFNPGTVNGLSRKAEIEGYLRHDLLEIDAATNPGSSGGPVIRPDGAVVGLVDAGYVGEQGRRLAVSSTTAKPLIDGWSAAPQPEPAGDCTSAVDPDGNPVPPDAFPTREDVQALTTLNVYFQAVNGGDFPTALAQLTHPGSLQSFSAGVASSYDTQVKYRTVRTEGSALVVWVTFTSQQDSGKGPAGRPEETCTDWSLDYTMVPKNGLWLIDATGPHDGTADMPCTGATTTTGTASGTRVPGTPEPTSPHS